MEYLHRFNSVQEFQDAYYGENYEQPWIGAVGSRDSAEPPVMSYNKFNDNGHEWVDLGLPSGTLWATMNVGAASITDKGNEYAWGEIETKQSYTWDNYVHGYRTVNAGNYKYTFYKYNEDDGQVVLLPEDDIAHLAMGGDWRMPTTDDMDELWRNVGWTSETVDGVCMINLVSNINGAVMQVPGRYFGLWSSSLYSSNILSYAHYLTLLDFSSRDVFSQSQSERCVARNVRGIIKPETLAR